MAQTYSISSIKRSDNKGGLVINGDMSIDYRHMMTIDFGNDSLYIESKETDDKYSGRISQIDFDGNRNPTSISDIIDWIKPGGIDFGGDKGISVTVMFDTNYFGGDGSAAYPITFDGVYTDNVTVTGKGTTTDPLVASGQSIGITPATVMAVFDTDALEINSATGKLKLKEPVATKLTVK